MELADLQRMLESLREVFLRLDSEGRITFLTRAWDKLCMQPAAAAMGHPLVAFIAPSDRPELESLLSAASPEETLELRLESPAPGIAWIELSAEARTDGFVVRLQDVTEKKRAAATAAHYQMLFNQATDILLVMHPDGRLIDANPEAERAYGYSRAELRAVRIEDLRAPATLPFVERDRETALTSGLRFETLHRRRDGSTFPVEVNAQRADGPEGPILVSVVRDITRQKQAEEAREKTLEQLEIVIKGVSDGILVLDAHRRVTYVNGVSARFFGFPDPRAMVGRVVDVRLDDFRITADEGGPVEVADLPSSHALRGEAVMGRVLHFVSKSTGTLRTMKITATPAFDDQGRVRFATCIFHDITEQRQLERLKSDFLNAVTHELRTPLTSIKGYAEFLEDGIGGALSAQQVAFVEQIQLGTFQLEVLVDDLLDFARIEAGKFTLRLQRFDLVTLIQQVAASFYPQAQEEGLNLRVEAAVRSLELEADSGRLTQVLNNLLSNAIKFTPRGGSIGVSLEPIRDGVRLRIADTGIGIAPEYLPRLFSKFFQVDSALNRSFKGTGLGLAITRALVEAHHGTIAVHSDGLHGTSFTIELPLQQLGAVQSDVLASDH